MKKAWINTVYPSDKFPLNSHCASLVLVAETGGCAHTDNEAWNPVAYMGIAHIITNKYIIL